jgi:hypothetical protein
MGNRSCARNSRGHGQVAQPATRPSRVFFQPTTAQMTKATHTTSAAATIT